MIIHIDASALVKRYVLEAGTSEVETPLATAELAGAALISRAEVCAAICKAVRNGVVRPDRGKAAVKQFRAHWPSLFRLKVDGIVVESADLLSWEHQLRGYGAVHLACALLWQNSLTEPVTMATFDRGLWAAARQAGLRVWPGSLE